MSEDAALQAKIERQDEIINGLENVLKLNEQELANAEEMIKVYETITEFSRKEMISLKDSIEAREATSTLSSVELKKAFTRIAELEAANQELRARQSEFKTTAAE
ncbi:MAG: hypothetical protein KDK39_03820 [Leptospiraceae bacterium]|nr:hypothetical protein [Leptospiraceae bacterium]